MTDQRPTRAALAMLITVQTLMLGSLYAGVEPHPPATIPPFALAPFLSVAIGTCGTAWIMGDSRAGRILSALSAVLALVSFGPQKYFDPAFPLIWPAVIAAQISVATLLAQLSPRLQRSARTQAA
ncbi:hypothetical protein [Tropicibacter naphthalenivorans]|uniref:Uncharacterized protein n=1 Tax=Tropicibacter naphthalenivorans TaxID=441103 RepID=A0A0P1G2S0_9RHOB|nr:hypothetical protein [Tropicibacter naphthalenivorans]CUH76115.1 hypothetical protein TRN7648_00787 [Tropicibacter naphthalenivorans]SMC39962.1 hypothetical protein SAMN04488093_10197 [Tropicibacter naphthalenivorans]